MKISVTFLLGLLLSLGEFAALAKAPDIANEKQTIVGHSPEEQTFRRRFLSDCATALTAVGVAFVFKPFFGPHEKPVVVRKGTQFAILSPYELKEGKIKYLRTKRIVPGRIYVVQFGDSLRLHYGIELEETLEFDEIGIPNGTIVPGADLWFQGEDAQKRFKIIIDQKVGIRCTEVDEDLDWLE